ncbi:MAG: hypothetical protein Q7T24_05585, partial [Deltaproteobacteria bacterium]|nr:hypothetical protein [Deltaproteobacteria bacterium]
KIEEGYRAFQNAAKDLAASVGELNGAFNELSSVQTNKDSSKSEAGLSGPFWFFKTGENYDKAKKDYINGIQETYDYLEKLYDKHVEFSAEKFSAIVGYDRLQEKSVESRKNVESKAYQAMEDQLLKFVETHRFSAKEFGKVMAQQVKIELTGLAARAAVWAIFETAMGFRDLAMGLPTAALHFTSAAEFGAVAGAALIAAAGVQEVLGGPTGTSSSGSGEGGAKALSGGIVPEANATTTQHITIQVYNPLSEQNWQKIVDDNIIPALKDAGDRNIAVTVKTM